MRSVLSTSAPILIAGPTASGKSAVALSIVERLGGMIVNADSMQVYRELRILSARPTPEEEARVPHALYGNVSAADAYSAGRFARDAGAAIADARNRGLRPIIVGGTGLYFKALTEGLSPVPEVDAAVRHYWRQEAERRGVAELHQELQARDTIMAARLAPTDTQRIVRALEVIDGTGRSLSQWQRLREPPVVEEADCVRLRVTLDRAELHARADARFDLMIAEGALEEARALANLGIDAGQPAMRAIGVRPLIGVVKGEASLGAAVEAAKLETRQYIKRQETWLKRHMITWNTINLKETESYMREIFAFIWGQH